MTGALILGGLGVGLLIVWGIISLVQQQREQQQILVEAQAEIARLEGRRLSGQTLSEDEATRLVTLQQTVQGIRDSRLITAISLAGMQSEQRH